MTMTRLRDAITIPERVSAGDHVLKLTEGVQNAAHAEHDSRAAVPLRRLPQCGTICRIPTGDPIEADGWRQLAAEWVDSRSWRDLAETLAR